MKLFFPLSLLLCLVTLCFPFTSMAGIDPANVIKPGRGLGDEIRLTDEANRRTTMREVLRLMENRGGSRPKVMRSGVWGDYHILYQGKGVKYIFHTSHEHPNKDNLRLQKIIITNPAFIVEGSDVGVSDDFEVIQRRNLLPYFLRYCSEKPAKDQNNDDELKLYLGAVLYKCPTGIAFIVNKSGVIQAIEVFSPPAKKK